jgi:hypothetical protein
MEWAALFKIVEAFGPSAICSALVVTVVYLIKEVHKNSEKDAQREEAYQKLIGSKLKELRDDTAKVLDEHRRRLLCVETEYVKREDFYRDLGGWKDDINRLSGQMSAQFTEFNKSIIDLWKGGRG